MPQQRATTIADAEAKPAADLDVLSAEISEQSRHYHEAAPQLLADEDSAASLVLHEVGRDKRVLELGTSTGYMSRAMAQHGCTVVGVELDPGAAGIAAAHCERMIVGNLDDPELLDDLGDDRFDVVVAADVLEHLKNPVGALRSAVSHLHDEGIVVVSLPNIAHVSVRIALLQGRFPYAETGLLDQTHLQFYDRERVLDTFERAGLAVLSVQPRYLDPEASTVPFTRDAVAERVVAETADDPDARTYQFIVVGYPVRYAPVARITHRLRELSTRAEVAERSQARLEQQIDSLAAQLAGVAASDAELRVLLAGTHQQLAERDEMLMDRTLGPGLRAEREARAYFEAESRAAHARLEGITGSRSWKAIVLLRRLLGRA